jgi:hypothetical protein
MALHWREERCDDCKAERERTWVVREIPKSLPVPAGFRVEHRGPTWKRIVKPTTTTTLCLCDC